MNEKQDQSSFLKSENASSAAQINAKILFATGEEKLNQYMNQGGRLDYIFFAAVNNAVYPFHPDFLDRVIEKGHIDVNKQLFGKGKTALHVAAIDGNDRYVGSLIRHNADVFAKDENGWTPLECAKTAYKRFAAHYAYDTDIQNDPQMIQLKKCIDLLQSAMADKSAMPHKIMGIKPQTPGYGKNVRS